MNTSRNMHRGARLLSLTIQDQLPGRPPSIRDMISLLAEMHPDMTVIKARRLIDLTLRRYYPERKPREGFSQFISVLLAAGDRFQDNMEEVRRWQAGEDCSRWVASSYVIEVKELLLRSVFTADTFEKECLKRGLSYKWQYEHIPPLEFYDEPLDIGRIGHAL